MAVLIASAYVLAHGGVEDEHMEQLPQESQSSTNPILIDPMLLIKFTVAWIIIITIFIFFEQNLVAQHKKLFFWMIAAPVILSTLYLSFHTIFSNIISETGGPVHWHAHYQVWTCRERLKLSEPKGLENKVGTSLMHVHNDDSIHIEGVLNRLEDARLFNTPSI